MTSLKRFNIFEVESVFLGSEQHEVSEVGWVVDSRPQSRYLVYSSVRGLIVS